jgi:hypothetical protein
LIKNKENILRQKTKKSIKTKKQLILSPCAWDVVKEKSSVRELWEILLSIQFLKAFLLIW